MLAAAFGAALYFTGGWQYLALMLIFLVCAVGATKYQHFRKREMGIYEHERSWENVLSNGLVPVAAAIASPYAGPMPFIASISAVMADKFASELGVLGGTPISLENLKPVKAGTSGAVSTLGFLVSLAGGTVIGVSGIFIFGISPVAALLVAFAGFFGSVVDSIFGIFEERGIGTKGTTNIICSLAGAAAGFFIR